MGEIERRYCEIECRADGGLSGVAVRYGDIARLPWGEERIEARAFGDDVDALDVVLNLQHRRDRPLARTGGGGLVLSDSPAALSIAATLPGTRDAEDALALVRANVLRGLSIEFSALDERIEAGGLRVIERAALHGVALVDVPAYPDAVVAARQAAAKRHWQARRRAQHWW